MIQRDALLHKARGVKRVLKTHLADYIFGTNYIYFEKSIPVILKIFFI